MADIEYYSLNTQKKLPYDSDSESYVAYQYNKWFVRVIAGKNVTPGVKIGERLLPFRWNDNLSGYLLPNAEEIEDLSAQAGLLTLYSQVDGTTQPLKPSLYISPASIPEREFTAILDRLGQLAIAQENGLLCPVAVLRQSTDFKSPNDSSKQTLSKVESFLHLANTIDNSWQLIQKTPAKELKLVPKIVDLSNPVNIRSRPAIYQSCQRPDKRRQEIREPQENYDTLENRFLAYVIKNVIIREAEPLADYFRSRSNWLRSIITAPKRFHGAGYLDLWRDRRAAGEQEANRLRAIADRIEQHAERGRGYLQAPFLKNLRSKYVPGSLPSAKIAQSIEYGPVYKAYHEFSRNHKAQQIPSRLSLVWALEEKAIKPVWQLYELWAFIEVYAILISSFGFQPKGDSPFDLIEVEDGEANLEKASTFSLYFTPKNITGTALTCDIELTYSPTIKPTRCQPGKACYTSSCQNLNLFCYREINRSKNWTDGLEPDIGMVIRSARGTKRIALDVKYRDYASQKNRYQEKREEFGANSVFELDLLGTAKMKYLDGLGLDAAFILHSDPIPSYTVFGDEPLPTLPIRERLLKENYFPAHRVGSVYISPDKLQNLEKLLRCILMYHAGLEEICWPCQNQLTVGNGGLTKQPMWKGDYYQCPDCGRFWIGTTCSSPGHHRLIKLGRASFHKLKNNDEWQCACPVCGNELEV